MPRNSNKDTDTETKVVKAVPANRYVIYFSVTIVGCLTDVATKRLVFDWLGMPGERRNLGLPDPWWLIEDVLGFQTSLNEGALFGMGQGGTNLFALLSVLAAIVIPIWLFCFRAARDRLCTIALAMISAGILGNLYDRLGIHGLKWNFANELHAVGEPAHAVRDFILVMIGNYHWPNFNVADSLLVCGAILLVWHAFWHDVLKRLSARARAKE